MIPRITATARLMAVILFFSAFVAQAGVVIDGTRVVYPEGKREVSIPIRNNSSQPSLVQTWLDNGNPMAQPDQDDVPFVLSPPLLRLNPEKSQHLRLVYTQKPLPQDRESLFWLSVLDVPAKIETGVENGSRLDLAFRHRIKVFFRPQTLEGTAIEAHKKIVWELHRTDEGKWLVKASNQSAFHVNLVALVLKTPEGQSVSVTVDMLPPFSSQRFALANGSQLPSDEPVEITYVFLNDQGGEVLAHARIEKQR